MLDYRKQGYLMVGMLLVPILFITTITKASHNPNYNLKQQTNIYNELITFINLEKTPDQIARSSETKIINSIEQSKFSKK